MAIRKKAGCLTAIKRYRRVLLAGMLSFNLVSGWSQSDSTNSKVWSLNGCMVYAVENNTAVKKQVYTNSIYAQDKLEAIGGLLPNVSGSVGARTSYGRSIDPGTNTYSNTGNFTNAYSIEGSMQVFGGLSAINAVKSAKAFQLMGGEQLQQAKDEVALQAMKAYFDVVYYSKSAEIAGEQVGTSRLTLEKTKKLNDLGLKSDADVAQVESQLASDELLLLQQQNQKELAVINLKEQMNYPLHDTLLVDINVSVETSKEPFTLSDVVDFALSSNPKVLSAGYNYRSSQLRYKSSRGKLLPSLYIGGGYSTNYYENLSSDEKVVPFSTQFRENRGYYFRASLSIPIFNGFSRHSEVARNRNRMHIAEQQNIEAQRAMQSEVMQTYQHLRGYGSEFVQASKKVEAADLAYQAMMQKFEKGLVDAIELQAAANQLLQAKSQKLNARLQYIIKFRMMEYYQGKPLVREN